MKKPETYEKLLELVNPKDFDDDARNSINKNMTQTLITEISDENKIKNPTVISLFCGAGGMDYGFEKAGFKTIWATDIDEYSLKTFKANIKCKNIINGDIRNLIAEEIPDNPDVIIGGFPCQGFSSAGKRNMCDERNSLAWEMIRIIRKKKT